MLTAPRALGLACSWAATCAPLAAPLCAQVAPAGRAEQVSYRNGSDAALLTGTLTLPSTRGPHPGVVVLSVADTEPLVDRLVADGYAVLTPVRRGFVSVEPLLRATFRDLAGDVAAALAYLAARPGIDPEALGLVAQADDTPPAILHAAASEGRAPPLVLLAPPAFGGVETFRLEQRWQAQRAGVGPVGLEALDRYVERIADIVLSESAPYSREYRLKGLRAGSSVQLPRSAAFPSDERQMHFFASPLWRDRLAFEPEGELARLGAPVLALIGTEDPNTPMDAYVAAIERGLSAAGTPDGVLCVLPGRTRHTFTDAAVTAVAAWLGERVDASGRYGGARAGPVPGCVEPARPGAGAGRVGPPS